jgi:hypothetical protein
MFVVYLHPCFLVVLEQGQALEMNVMQNGQMAIYSLIGQERIGEVAEIERARERVHARASERERARERERESESERASERESERAWERERESERERERKKREW